MMPYYNRYLFLPFRMLSFTYDQARRPNKAVSIDQDYEIQPIIITNGGRNPKPAQMPSPRKKEAKLIRSDTAGKLTSKQAIRKQEKIDNRVWNNDTNHNFYDKKLKKNQLQARQRELRAQARKQEALRKQNKEGIKEEIVAKEHEIQNRIGQKSAENKQRQIQRLKELIQKQKREKEQNDRKYEEKKRQIEAERARLREVQKKYQEQGAKAVRQISRQLKNIRPSPQQPQQTRMLPTSNKLPSNPAPRSHPQFQPHTQSELMQAQQSRLRQQRLQFLANQRQKVTSHNTRNLIGSNPTLIPLLSRASYKIISTQISNIVNLFIDDLLEEQVHLLQAIELETVAAREKQKQKEILSDYVHKLEEFVDEVDEIEDRIGRYGHLKFEDFYKPKPKYQQAQDPKPAFSYNSYARSQLQCRLTGEQLEQITHRKERFRRFVNSFDEYKPDNLSMFRQATEEMIDEAIDRLARELDSGAGEFVNIVFRSQFA